MATCRRKRRQAWTRRYVRAGRTVLAPCGSRTRRLRRADSIAALGDRAGAAGLRWRRVAEEGQYVKRSLADGLKAFQGARLANVEQLRALAPDDWSRTGTQQGVGVVALRDMPRLMAAHDAEHRQEIEEWLHRRSARNATGDPHAIRAHGLAGSASAGRRWRGVECVWGDRALERVVVDVDGVHEIVARRARDHERRHHRNEASQVTAIPAAVVVGRRRAWRCRRSRSQDPGRGGSRPRSACAGACASAQSPPRCSRRALRPLRRAS